MSDQEVEVSEESKSENKEDLLVQEGEIAADYLEGLLDIADLDGDLIMDVENGRAMVSITGAELNELVGDKGKVLDALQELTRLAVTRETGERSRLMLDISGHREKVRAKLTELAQETVQKVLETGEPIKLKAMTSFERKIVHDAVAEAGAKSISEGETPHRRIVVHPA